MNTEVKIQTVKKYMQQKLCFGLKVEGSEICRDCPLATECAPLRVARLTYELQQLEVVVAKPEADAEYEARMEGMSKAKFEAMIDKALNRRAELETMIVKALGREAERKARTSDSTAPGAQQTTQGVKGPEKARPSKTGEQPEQQATKVVKTKEKGRSSGGSRFTATRVFSFSSFWMVARDTTDTPIPASTAPFTASGLPSSIATLSVAWQSVR